MDPIVVRHSGPLNARLAVFGEGPGGNEERLGVPFVGDSGDELNLGLGGPAMRAMTYVDNILPVRSAEGLSSEEKMAAAFEYTPRFLNQRLPELTEARTILMVGALPFWYFTGITHKSKQGKLAIPIMKYHGSVFSRDEVEALHRALGGPPRPPLPPNVHSLVANLHPSFALHAGDKFWMREIHANTRRALTWSNRPAFPPRRSRFEAVLGADPDTLARELEGAKSFVFDLETLREDKRFIRVGAISTRLGRVLAFAWSTWHAMVLRRYFESKAVVKIGHNSASFDTVSLAANDVDVDGQMFDSINASSLLWVPVPNKQQQEAGKKKLSVGRLSLGRIALRLLEGEVYWKEPETAPTQIIYGVDWPEVPTSLYEQLYCAQDVDKTGRIHIVVDDMLKRNGLHRTYVQYEMPAQLPLARMDIRGMGLDVEAQKVLRKREQRIVAKLRVLIRRRASEYHSRRYEEQKAAVEKLATDLEGILPEGASRAGRCAEHPDYVGRIKRSTCEGCARVFEGTSSDRARRAEVRVELNKEKTKLERISEKFEIGKDDHWRWLLFEALGFEAPFETDTGLARVNLEAMERLLKDHPEEPLLRWRVDVQHSLQVIRGVLKVKPSADGRVHGVRSMNKTASGRTSAGKDDQEIDKARKSPLNFNNIKKQYRRIFVASPPEWWMVDADWSQIEARIVAWHAQEIDQLALWREGGDLHVENAVLIARELMKAGLLPKEEIPEEPKARKAWTKRTLFPSVVLEGHDIRHAGKIGSHGWNFGMDRTSKRGAVKTAKEFGIPVEVATNVRDAYFARWKMIDRFQETVIWLAGKNRHLIQSFGRKSMEYRMKKTKNGYVLADVEEALSFAPQSEPSSMIKVCMGLMDDWFREIGEGKLYKRGALLTTTYDELLTECPPEDVPLVAAKLQEVMEREWPELGIVKGFGPFKCPAEVTVGKNWGAFHRHDEKCNGKCGQEENLWGQRELDEWRKEGYFA